MDKQVNDTAPREAFLRAGLKVFDASLFTLPLRDHPEVGGGEAPETQIHVGITHACKHIHGCRVCMYGYVNRVRTHDELKRHLKNTPQLYRDVITHYTTEVYRGLNRLLLNEICP